ncbi:hypothetical protein SAICODRAFT_30892 [Saitoella complicata NRRL Y-17804]|uniref:RING-type domain-containing protein n=1 Tax=Saitoella complicata (strain BCRC 22490 / CBS 7301 / JCM 7358 / NBRC 10748 / NRRL Y-17804) TaxID=698492 RepID=A0A0E9NI59_SAICN|nr:uncharacterized protein SAICODRAFT_30892 [Saitoella complicata NRRL Y-17804]ODQ52113.1 hypothetical protein SAICODRAFT_30892 [Saitoella complicata NRRL Y-17804]GAO49493.1 hypothetical protein G7K_3642-t1 [Saitoella complicata NRRL Y-17804]
MTMTERHEYQYADAVSDHFMCPVCRSVLVEPVQTRCGHIFCTPCIESALSHSRTCPVDRAALTQSDLLPAPKIIANIVNELLVVCPNQSEGCPNVLQRQLLGTHLEKECDYAWVLCPGAECDEMVLRKDLSGDGECAHEMEMCEMCKRIIRDNEAHVSICPAVEVSCRYCSTHIQRGDLDAHLSGCPEAVSTCPAEDVGCPWTGPRRELSDHTLLCTLVLIAPALRTQASRISALESENHRLRSSLHSLSQPPLDPSLTREFETLVLDQERLRNDVASMDMQNRMFVMNEGIRMREEVQELRTAVWQLKAQVHWLMVDRERRMGSAGVGIPSSRPGSSELGGHGQERGEPPRRLNDNLRQLDVKL